MYGRESGARGYPRVAPTSMPLYCTYILRSPIVDGTDNIVHSHPELVLHGDRAIRPLVELEANPFDSQLLLWRERREAPVCHRVASQMNGIVECICAMRTGIHAQPSVAQDVLDPRHVFERDALQCIMRLDLLTSA